MISLCLLWHMHQPDYRHPVSGEYTLPWVRLHAVKGYLDLLSVLRAQPAARCVVNFSGILLEQLTDYAAGSAHDQYSALSVKPAAELSEGEREFVLTAFFSANTANLINPHPRYSELKAKRDRLMAMGKLAGAAKKFTDDELTDLMVWFNLAWVGFSGQRRREVAELITKGRGFDLADQQRIVEIHAEIIRKILPGYRELQEAGKIELSFTPHQHPILPLLIDLRGEGHQDSTDPLPEFQFAGDAHEQVRRGADWYQRAFNCAPRGAWPAEGSVSDAALGELASSGITWAMTDQQNLPLEVRSPLSHLTPYSWQQDGSKLALFFRDTRLADNIGFEYARWQPTVAARHMLDMVRALGRQAGRDEPVVTVALDGENPWENYPDGGEAFLSLFFEQVLSDAEVCCTTPSEIVERSELPQLTHVSAGSWIGGNFDIWSRHAETRLAWRLLSRTRSELIDVCHGEVYEHLLAAEGSDWFWWYGDDFSTQEQAQFDALYRGHLIAAYECAGRDVPEELMTPIYSERRPELVEMVETLIEPQLDGRVSTYFEWQGALRVESDPSVAAMARANGGAIRELWYGFSSDALFILLKLEPELLGRLRSEELSWEVAIDFKQGEAACLRAVEGKGLGQGESWALDDVLELELPLNCAEISRDATGFLAVEFRVGEQAYRFPQAGRIAVRIIPADFSQRQWLV